MVSSEHYGNVFSGVKYGYHKSFPSRCNCVNLLRFNLKYVTFLSLINVVYGLDMESYIETLVLRRVSISNPWYQCLLRQNKSSVQRNYPELSLLFVHMMVKVWRCSFICMYSTIITWLYVYIYICIYAYITVNTVMVSLKFQKIIKPLAPHALFNLFYTAAQKFPFKMAKQSSNMNLDIISN